MRYILCAALLAIACGVPVARLSAAPVLHSFDSLALSPDGHRVLALESDDHPDSATVTTTLILRDVPGGRAHRLAACEEAACTLDAPTWAPDGEHFIYVLRDRKRRVERLVIAAADGRDAHTLVSLRGDIGTPRFAPDGALAVLATSGAQKEIGATQAGAAIVGEIGTRPDVQRIAIVLSDGRLRFVSPPDLFVYEYDWQPSGKGFVATGAHGNGDDDWWIARLYAIDAAGSAREIYAPPLQIANPRVSPDGSSVAFIGGLMSDFGSTGGDVFSVPLQGGAAVDLTPGFAGSAELLTWNGDSKSVTFVALTGDRHAVDTVDVVTHELRTLWSGELNILARSGELTFASDHSTNAVVRETFERAPEIAVGPLGKWRDLTSANAHLLAVTRARSVQWQNDGFDVQGWLLAPLRAAAQPNGTFPMIVTVHGGPSAAFEQRFIGAGTTRALLARGWYVFLPNPRGSFGQGERFTQANVKDFGGGDLRDILTGIDAAEKVAPVDDARLGITGGSYGGYMTMFAVTQTGRFKAAVAGAGIANWLSYYGENGIDQWMIPFFGASAYDDPAVYAKSSPITFIRNVRTPTFEFVGERDVECPAPQTQEFWHALATMGVPTSFVVYAGEGHHIRSLANIHDIERRTLGWFARYLR